MKPATRLVAFFWLILGSLTLLQAFQGAPMPLSLKFFATIQVIGAVTLIVRLAIGYFLLITMSAFTMVSGIFAMIAVMFMPADELQRVPSLWGIPPRGILAGFAFGAVIAGRLCWQTLRKNPPANWKR